MIRNIFHRRSVGIACMLAMLVFSAQNIYATLEGKWVKHPAMTSRATIKEAVIHRIIDGNRYLYISARGGHFNRGSSFFYTNKFNCDNLQLFRYDKTQPFTADNIKAVTADPNTSGDIIDIIEYSPRLGALAVIYDNRKIDIIFDDGRMIQSNALKDLAFPTATATPYSITFDTERSSFYVAASFGYIEVDATTGELLQCVRLDMKTAYAARVGNNMVVMAGNTVAPNGYNTSAYFFPADNPPATLAGHEIMIKEMLQNVPMGSKHYLANFQGIMPLTDNSFLTFGPYNSDINFSIVHITLGEVNHGAELFDRQTVDNNALTNYRHYLRTDGFWNATKEGYVISTNANVYVIKSGIELDYNSTTGVNAFKATAAKAVSKDNLDDTEKKAKLSTNDGKRFWFYNYTNLSVNDVKGFYTRDLNLSAWGEKSEIVAPNAPTMTNSLFMEWNPNWGIICRGPGTYYDFDADGNDLLCAYKDGRWTDISFMSRDPANVRLTWGMRELNHDPLYPDHIWSACMRTGLSRDDLSDFNNSMILGSSVAANMYKPAKNYFNVMPNGGPGWAANTNFSNVSFDNNGVMWFSHDLTFDTYYGRDDYLDTYVPLMYYTADERRAMATDLSNVTEPHQQIKIPHTITHRYPRIIALKAPGNDNILVHSACTYAASLFRYCQVYDHKGTLEDTSDDEFVAVRDLLDENGDMVHYSEEKGLYEDPLTGEVWLFTDHGVIIFDPKDLLAGNMRSRKLSPSAPGLRETDDFNFDCIIVYKVEHDLYGRKWIATDSGVFCLSPDTKTLLGHFTSGNSPLPDDVVNTLACDMETGSVFIGTFKGIIEFQPAEGTQTTIAAGTHLSVWPSQITPDYNGYVNIAGAVNGVAYEVVDKEGNAVATLGMAADGRFQWNCAGTDGNRLQPGRYSIRRSGVEESHPIVILE